MPFKKTKKNPRNTPCKDKMLLWLQMIVVSPDPVLLLARMSSHLKTNVTGFSELLRLSPKTSCSSIWIVKITC